MPTLLTRPVTALCCRQAGKRLLPSDQVSSLVGAVLAHVIATLAYRSLKAMWPAATGGGGRSPSAV